MIKIVHEKNIQTQTQFDEMFVYQNACNFMENFKVDEILVGYFTVAEILFFRWLIES